MQTFLPYKDFSMSAEALDSKRLNKQILECYQILKVLSNKDPHAGWRNHPAVKMWRGFEHLLLDYTMTMVKEADKRGIKTDKNVSNIMDLINTHGIDWGFDIPEWYEDEVKMKRLTTTHKANLYKKDPVYYFEFFSAVAKSNPCCPSRKEPCKYYWVAHEEAA
jgi:hypothetical protein